MHIFFKVVCFTKAILCNIECLSRCNLKLSVIPSSLYVNYLFLGIATTYITSVLNKCSVNVLVVETLVRLTAKCTTG